MTDFYGIDSLCNLPDGFRSECIAEHEKRCPVCGEVASWFYVFRPPRRRSFCREAKDASPSANSGKKVSGGENTVVETDNGSGGSGNGSAATGSDVGGSYDGKVRGYFSSAARTSSAVLGYASDEAVVGCDVCLFIVE